MVEAEKEENRAIEKEANRVAPFEADDEVDALAEETLYDEMRTIVDSLRTIGEMLKVTPVDEGRAFDTTVDELFALAHECKIWVCAMQLELKKLAGPN